MITKSDVAKDVLEHIDAYKIIPINGIFLDDWDGNSYNKTYFDKGGNCTVCAKGAIVAAWIIKNNKYRLKDFYYDEFPTEVLEIFTRAELDRMEVIYENQDYSWTTCSTKNVSYVYELHNFYIPSTILRKLLEYIIEKNKVPTYKQLFNYVGLK